MNELKQYGSDVFFDILDASDYLVINSGSTLHKWYVGDDFFSAKEILEGDAEINYELNLDSPNFFCQKKEGERGNIIVVSDGENTYDFEFLRAHTIPLDEFTDDNGIKDSDMELIDIAVLDEVLGDVPAYSKEGREIVRTWLNETSTYLYERPRELFSIAEAYRLAKSKGCKRLIANDLS